MISKNYGLNSLIYKNVMETLKLFMSSQLILVQNA